MNSMKKFLSVTLLIGLLILGCEKDDDNPTAPNYTPTEDDYAETVEDFGASLAGSDEGMMNMWMDTDVNSWETTAVDFKSGQDAAVDDTTIQVGNLTLEFDFTYYNANGGETEIYDPLRTVRATSLLKINGSIEGLRRTASIDHEGSNVFTGIRPVDLIRTINGSGHRTVESTFTPILRGSERTYVGTHNWTTDNFQFHVNRAENPYPLDGAITVISEVSQTVGDAVYELTIEFSVSFDGSQYAAVLIDGETNYWIDLETGAVLEELP